MNDIIWTPQPRQMEFMRRGENEALYGGAAGGGKSDAMVMEATRQVHIPHYKGLILRKTYPQLTELIDKSLFYYRRAFPGAKYNEQKHTWFFPSGAKIVFGSMQHSSDKLDYQGKAYDFIGFDELTHFTFDEYIYLLSRCRPNGPGTRCYMRATANPGGVGHSWVKSRFIKAAPPMQTIWEQVDVCRPDGKTYKQWLSRVFIPSSVFDNRKLLENDPGYLARLAMMPEAEKKALLYGDWDSFAGQFFEEWRDNPDHYDDRIRTHVIRPFTPPESWPIYRSFDWGYSRPFSCGWWAVDGDNVAYRIEEFYGCKPGQANVGLKWDADHVFAEIHRIESEHPWLRGKHINGIADPAIFAADGGQSINDHAMRNGVYFSPGDHQRIPGWMQMHYRLRFDETGRPKMYVFSNCKAFIRTLPSLVYDDNKVEDLDTEGEDHIADETRYFCMARPISAPKPEFTDGWNSSPARIYLDIDKSDVQPYVKNRERMKIYENG